MKLLLICAGSHRDGATAAAMKIAELTLKKKGCEYSCFYLDSSEISPCSACGACKENGECIYNDKALTLSKMLPLYDGFMFFTPVHYGGAAGRMKAALVRLFYSAKQHLEYKPAAAVAVARRAGCISALEEITKFFSFASMPEAHGKYPGVIYAKTAEDVNKDSEGVSVIDNITGNLYNLAKILYDARCMGIYP